MGRFFFHVMASRAQMERELIVERTRAGLDAAKKQGRVGSRKRQMTSSKIERTINHKDIVIVDSALIIESREALTNNLTMPNMLFKL